MFRRSLLLVFSLSALSAAGCFARNRSTDYLQAQLRVQEQSLTDLQTQLDKTVSDLQLARREVDSLRTQLADSGHSQLPAEQAAVLLRVSDVKINSMLTSGLNEDGKPGDDRIVVHFAPYDDDGEVVKLPGRIRITAQDPALNEDERTVGTWSFTAEECRKHWVRGFLGSGYQFALELAKTPVHTDLVVQLTLDTPDGRSFNATHIVRVRPAEHSPIAERVPRPDVDEFEGVTRTGASTPEAAAPTTALKPARLPPPPPTAPIQDSTNWTESEIPIRR